MVRLVGLMKWARGWKRIAWFTVAVMACGDATSPTTTTSVTLGRRLIAGEQVACALRNDGTVFCWGGNSTFWEYAAAPATLPGGDSPLAAAVSPLYGLALGVGTHFCGLSSSSGVKSGSATCWGRNDAGQLGGGNIGLTGEAPSVVAGGVKWADLSVGRITTCGVSDAGVGYCWGINQRGEIGSTSVDISFRVGTPTIVEGGRIWKSIAAGWLHSCGVTTAGAAYCWGGNQRWQLGTNTTDTTSSPIPVAVSGGLSFSQLSLGSVYSCGLTVDGSAYCWGDNSTGQLGDGTRTSRIAPTIVSGGLKFTQIVASSGFGAASLAPLPVPEVQGGAGHTCALTAEGKAYCWGWNGSGELGDGTTTDRLAPTAVADGRTFTTLAVGGAYTCGMKGDAVWCWGSNANGQLGKGDRVSASRPQPVLAPFR